MPAETPKRPKEKNGREGGEGVVWQPKVTTASNGQRKDMAMKPIRAIEDRAVSNRRRNKPEALEFGNSRRPAVDSESEPRGCYNLASCKNNTRTQRIGRANDGPTKKATARSSGAGLLNDTFTGEKMLEVKVLQQSISSSVDHSGNFMQEKPMLDTRTC